MPCESCAVQFSMFKRKRACSECERFYCSSCLRRGGGAMCAPCRVLSTRPLTRQAIAHLKVRDLQCFLQRQNVSTRGCVEKEELLSLCVSHVNSAAYRRRGSRAGASPFSSLKGLTSNINDFINSAFDIRNVAHPAPAPPTRGGCGSNCFNSAHVHNNTGGEAPPSRPWPSERFTTTPGGEVDIEVPVPSASVSRSASGESARVDTADCFEIEDLDDTGWEFVNRPADPLPNDSDVLLSTMGSFVRRAPPMSRAASELELRRPASPPRRADAAGLRGPSPRGADSASLRDADTASLHDAPLMDDTDTDNATDDNATDNDNGTPKHIRLEQFSRASELDVLNVKQLKELLVRNRVEYRGCLERRDLLERAKTLWRNHAQYKDGKQHIQHNRVEYRGCLERRDLLERAKTLWRNHAQYKDGKQHIQHNRVEYRGCLERRDLLERAKTLWRNHAQYKDGKQHIQHNRVEYRGCLERRDLLERAKTLWRNHAQYKDGKQHIQHNRVEYRGCLERRDLLERAKTLWRNHAQYKDDIDNLPAEECCKICMAAPLECVLLECGHIAACTACAKQLAECPICRQYVVRAVRFFRS
ncbi:hypothetical protein PYW07_004215 [Mythimna separata]|uniref:RING-type domain-containing protein n=1 Tax=Mythimna separata TaxID=271217 RepID=A0AAD7YPT0_MYTSE|nr:hypothetical protein PYW07_004215 [Mythimna separata]